MTVQPSGPPKSRSNCRVVTAGRKEVRIQGAKYIFIADNCSLLKVYPYLSKSLLLDTILWLSVLWSFLPSKDDGTMETIIRDNSALEHNDPCTLVL